jgi:hypothetical protein
MNLMAAFAMHRCRARPKSQNLAVFSQVMTEDQWRIVLYYFISAEFVWRLNEMPLNGTIVVVAHVSQPFCWSYLPDGAARLDVESGFAKSYQWYESVDCQAMPNIYLEEAQKCSQRKQR